MFSAPFPKVDSFPLVWFNEAMKYVRNRVKSLSLSSRENQAKFEFESLLMVCNHSATSVVFPNPAGAETRVNLQSVHLFNCSIKRGLGTSSGRVAGIKSLVTKIWAGMKRL